jgi:hypothetical protein
VNLFKCVEVAVSESRSAIAGIYHYFHMVGPEPLMRIYYRGADYVIETRNAKHDSVSG